METHLDAFRTLTWQWTWKWAWKGVAKVTNFVLWNTVRDVLQIIWGTVSYKQEATTNNWQTATITYVKKKRKMQ